MAEVLRPVRRPPWLRCRPAAGEWRWSGRHQRRPGARPGRRWIAIGTGADVALEASTSPRRWRSAERRGGNPAFAPDAAGDPSEPGLAFGYNVVLIPVAMERSTRWRHHAQPGDGSRRDGSLVGQRGRELAQAAAFDEAPGSTAATRGRRGLDLASIEARTSRRTGRRAPEPEPRPLLPAPRAGPTSGRSRARTPLARRQSPPPQPGSPAPRRPRRGACCATANDAIC